MRKDERKKLIQVVTYRAKELGLAKNDGTPNQSKIAREARKNGYAIDPKSIGNALKCDGGNITTKTLDAIKAALKLSHEELFDVSRIIQNFSMVLPRSRQIPVLGSIWSFVPDTGTGKAKIMEDRGTYVPDDVIDSITVNIRDMGKEAFALIFAGESMAPRIRNGETVVVDPDIVPAPGDIVVAQLHDLDTFTIRRYRPRGQDKQGVEIIELAPENEDWPTIIIDADNPGTVIGKVIMRLEQL